ncbi:hypothetical protein ACJIZ3_016726 [Penstemon smallii]|uniref:Peptidase A1 domain-containing protein n=1 Tax=Penstemon smallii TaxID=265156 RepID=A0ABD3STJ4_9LAMI
MSIKSSLFFFFLVPLLFKTSFPAFLAPITKDLAKTKYSLSIYLKTPPQHTNLVLDLGASFTLLDCSNYTSSTYRTIPCGSSLCTSLGSSCTLCSGSSGPGCSNNSCALLLGKSRKLVTGEAGFDSLYLHVTNGRNPGRLGVIPEFMFSCTLLKGLVKGASGLTGFGRSTLSLPAQVSNFSSENLIFTLCLSGSPSAPGVAFFGIDGPYYFHPEIDLSKHFNYTPLIMLNQVGSRTISYTDSSNEYFIGLTSIKVNGKAIEFDRTLLSTTKNGFGGTKLSTMTPYTVLQTTIFNALTEAFVKEELARFNLTVTTPVKPFKVCYEAKDILSTHVGPSVPTIDLVLHDEDVVWRIFGSNSMVRVFREGTDHLWCLGFLDGGLKPRTSIVIGGHQMEDNLLQFDLGSKRLGFTSSVLVHGTMCANFNFTMQDQ